MQELIPVNIVIGDRTYRVKIKPEDEGALRSTIKTINDKILEFKTNFAGKDMQDYVSMVLVWYATQSVEKGISTSTNTSEDTTAAFAEIEKMISNLLSAS